MPPTPGAQRPDSWRATLLRWGRLRAIAAITVFSIVISVVLTAALMPAITPANDRVWLLSLLIATVVPLAVAPLASYFLLSLVIELEQVRANLFQMATRDGLTAVYNRRYFMDQLQVETERAARTGNVLSLMILDIDRFKAVNDDYGHLAGDQTLRQLAQVCAAAVRPYDVLARYGGEEFVVLMPGTQAADALRLAERLRGLIQATSIILADDHRVGVTASFGVCQITPPASNPTTALARADAALFEAKRGGRNRCVLAPEPVAGGTMKD